MSKNTDSTGITLRPSFIGTPGTFSMEICGNKMCRRGNVLHCLSVELIPYLPYRYVRAYFVIITIDSRGGCGFDGTSCRPTDIIVLKHWSVYHMSLMGSWHDELMEQTRHLVTKIFSVTFRVFWLCNDQLKEPATNVKDELLGWPSSMASCWTGSSSAPSTRWCWANPSSLRYVAASSQCFGSNPDPAF